MANPFFNTNDYSNEQFLIDDLVRESIDIYGIDVDYLPATYENVDELYVEDDLRTYSEHTTMSMYIRDIEGFQGEGDFLGRFGVEIRDTMTFLKQIIQFRGCRSRTPSISTRLPRSSPTEIS